MRIDVEKILRPVAVVAGLRPGHVVLGKPHIAHRRRNPDRRDAELGEVTALQRELDPAQIATVIAIDVALRSVVKLRITFFRDVVLLVTIVEAVGYREVDHILAPRPLCSFRR